MPLPTQREQLIEQLTTDVAGLGVATAAYSAAAIRRYLDTHPRATQAERSDALAAIVSQPNAGLFTPAQARRFANQYTPTDALDDKVTGAGAIVLQDRHDRAFVIGVRGSDFVGHTKADLNADHAIALNTLPMAQTVSVINFALRATTPKDQTVVQIGVHGVAHSGDDVARGKAKLKRQIVGAATSWISDRPHAPHPPPQPYVVGYAKGLGTALGACKVVGTHSKGGPVTLVANAAWQCAQSVTYNAPHTALDEAQTLVNFTTKMAHLPAVNVSSMHARHIVGEGPSWIAHFNAPPGTASHVLPIPHSLFTPLANHGTAMGLAVAQERLQLALENSQLTTIAQIDHHLLHRQGKARHHAHADPEKPQHMAGDAIQALIQLAQDKQWSADDLQQFFQTLALALEQERQHPQVRPVPTLR